MPRAGAAIAATGMARAARTAAPPRGGRCSHQYCTFVMALGPDSGSQGLLELGAYGSTMEGPLPHVNPSPLQYVKPGMPQGDLDEFCSTLPPLYSQSIKVRPVQVTDQTLIHSLG
ncbi:hypothetical protein OKW40_000277 [Paraburkholderia sp. RAU6.4a]|uniref:hypothetical protein n=1 Tax=Paraburkholderia sp. RAU6.4a TaxID=2991067 RepID=UPI003D256863